MGFPQQPNQPTQQYGFAPQQPPAQQPQFAPPPAFNPAGLSQQPQAPAAASVEDRLAALEASHRDVRDQTASLTAAVNGLGQNTEALHQWVVGTMESVVGMIGSIVQQVQQEGVMKMLTGFFTGGPQQSPQQPPQVPQPPQR